MKPDMMQSVMDAKIAAAQEAEREYKRANEQLLEALADMEAVCFMVRHRAKIGEPYHDILPALEKAKMRLNVYL